MHPPSCGPRSYRSRDRLRDPGEIVIASEIPARWRLEELLVRQPGLRIVPEGPELVLVGRLEFSAEISGKARISDRYEVEIRIPEAFPRAIPVVFETGNRIRFSYHRLLDGSLCLGSETRLRLMLAEGLSLVGFVERCVIPYLYRYSYLKAYGEAPFEDLEHGPDGIAQDLQLLLGLRRQAEVVPFVRLLAMRKRHANKQRCPCSSGRRLGRCHHLLANRLRSRLGRFWFRVVEQQLASSVPSGKSSGLSNRLSRWQEDLLADVFSEKSGKLRVRSGVTAPLGTQIQLMRSTT